MKKLLSVLLAALLICSCVPLGMAAFADSDASSQVIWQAEPGLMANHAAGAAIASNWQNAYAISSETENGIPFYRIANANATGDKYTIFETNNKEGSGNSWRKDLATLNAIRQYMRVSVDVRCVSLDSNSENVSVSLRASRYTSMSNYANLWLATLVAGNVANDGEWHTLTNTVSTNFGAVWDSGFITAITKNVYSNHIDIRNFTISFLSSDKAAINSALSAAGSSWTFDTIVSYHNTDKKSMIWQAEPGRFGDTGQEATVNLQYDTNSKYPVMINSDQYGYYYSITTDGTTGNKYCYARSIASNIAWMGNKDLLNAIRPYMNITLDARCTNLNESDSFSSINIEVGTARYNYESSYRYMFDAKLLSSSVLPNDGQWHTFTQNGATEFLLNWQQGYVTFNVKPEGHTYRLDIRNFNITFKDSDAKAINDAIAAAGLDTATYNFGVLTDFTPFVYIYDDGTRDIIWQAEPGLSSAFDGQLLNSSNGLGGLYNVYAAYENGMGYYDVVLDDNSTGAKYCATPSGLRDINLPWMNVNGVLSAVAPFMQISADVRVTPIDDSPVTSTKFFMYGSTPYLYNVLTFNNGTTVSADGEWHSFTQSGAVYNKWGWYSGDITLAINKANATDKFNFSIRNIKITFRACDADAINSALSSAGVDTNIYNYATLTSYVPFYNADTCIWYANPDKLDNESVIGKMVSGSDAVYSAYNPSIAIDENDGGSSFHVDMTVSGGGSDAANSLINTGVNSKVPGYGWMANKDILDALAPYMYVGAQYKFENLPSNGTTSITLRSAGSSRISSGNGYALKQFNVAGSDYWYELPLSKLSGEFRYAWSDGYISLSIYNNSAAFSGIQKIDIRNLRIYMPSICREQINAALSQIEGINEIKNFTAGITLGTDSNGNYDYFELLSGVPAGVAGDINDDGNLDILDLVRAKKASLGLIYIQSACLGRVENSNGYIDASSLVSLRKALLAKQPQAAETYVLSLVNDHPGVPELDATYELRIFDKNGIELNASDFNWSSNFESVTIDGSTVTVPWLVRISAKKLVVTATNKTDASLFGTYTFTFQNYTDSATFSDDFDGDELDTEKWRIGHDGGSIQNGGTLVDGKLVLTVNTTDSLAAEVSTKRAQAFGAFSARVKLPSDGLVNAATWLYTYNEYLLNPYNPDYSGGEIDIVEYLPETDNYMTTVHWYGYQDNDAYKSELWFNGDNSLGVNDDEYHIVSTVWTKNAIYWYLDGRLIRTYTGEGVGQGAAGMWMILSLRTGVHPSFGGVLDENDFPVSACYDWVRIYGLN